MNHTHIRLALWGLAMTALVLVTGCASAPAATPTPTPPHLNSLRPYDETANAQQAVNAALALAKTDGKYVLVDFGGNWCPDCIVLAKYYETEPLKSFVEKNYHIVSVDVGQFNKNLDLSARYGDPIKQGVPAVVILDGSGEMVGSTGDGALESARGMTVQQVLSVLQKLTPSGR